MRRLSHALPLPCLLACLPWLAGCPTDVGSGDTGTPAQTPPDSGGWNNNPPADSGTMMTGGPHDSGTTNPPHDAGQTNPPHDGGVMMPPPDAGMMMGTGVSGDVSGMWSGQVMVTGNVTVQAGQTLEVLAGTQVDFADMTSLTVNGTLKLDGTAQSRIVFTNSGTHWVGLRISGTVQGGGLDLSKGSLCISGLAGSSITLDSTTMTTCAASMRLANGGTFTKTTITGGQTVSITGGVLNMTDSVIDLQQQTNQFTDCTDWAGGSATLDHVRFTACHCPLHFNSTSGAPITITNSIFDVAAVPIMIANSAGASMTHSHILGSPQLDDIGGNIQFNVAGNYWGGGAPTVATGNTAQFTGTDMFSMTPFTDVGPRP